MSEPLTMSAAVEAKMRLRYSAVCGCVTCVLLRELDATREAHKRTQDELQNVREAFTACSETLYAERLRFGNPWTIEILNHANNQWSDFCHDAPITLGDAEKRASDLKAEHPAAKFRVVPWLNSSQRQFVQQGRKALLDECDSLAPASAGGENIALETK